MVRVIVQTRTGTPLYTQKELDAAVDAALADQARRLGLGRTNDTVKEYRVTAAGLADAWAKYMQQFQSAPRGKERQLASLLELVTVRSRR